MLSNEYFIAKFRFGTAKNEPAKKLQTFANFPNFANPNVGSQGRGGGLVGQAAGPRVEGAHVEQFPGGGHRFLVHGVRLEDQPDREGLESIFRLVTPSQKRRKKHYRKWKDSPQ